MVDAQHKGHSGQLNTATHVSVSCPYSWFCRRRRRRLYGPSKAIGKAMTGGRRRSYYHVRRQLLRWRPGCKDGCCGWLGRVLLAMSGMLCSVAVSGGTWPTVAARPLCRVAVSLWLPVAAEETQARKQGPDSHRFPPGRLARRERHRRSTCCCCGTSPLLECCWTCGPLKPATQTRPHDCCWTCGRV